MYWSPRDLPAMQRLMHRERRDLCREYAWRSFKRWQTWAGLLSVIVAAVGTEALAMWQLPRTTFGNGPLHGSAPVAIAEMIGLWVWMQMYLHWMNRTILDENPQLCRVCGYDLRVTPERCPECGNCPEHAVGDALSNRVHG